MNPTLSMNDICSGSMITMIQIENEVNDLYLICITKYILSNKKKSFVGKRFPELFNPYSRIFLLKDSLLACIQTNGTMYEMTPSAFPSSKNRSSLFFFLCHVACTVVFG